MIGAAKIITHSLIIKPASFAFVKQEVPYFSDLILLRKRF